MGYYPTIILKRQDLIKHQDSLEQEIIWADENTIKLNEFLLDVIKDNNVIKFGDLELLICYPEFTTFNQDVRDKLDELDVEYKTDW